MDNKRYQVIGALDTETTNLGNVATGYKAFPILYQLGELRIHITDVTPANAEGAINVTTYRQCEELYKALDDLIKRHRSIVPVILVHNLGFDMHAIAPYLSTKNVRVLAKTSTKPISFQVLGEDGNPVLVFLDTLGMFMKSLAVMGEECGYPKAVGDWDYMKVRTPETPLTEQELNYAKHDIYALLCYMAYFLRQNPDIRADDIGLRVQTKTGIVRAKRLVNVGNKQSKKLPYKVRQYWHLHNREQKPKSDDELFTMHASTRGGFTFCARNNAGKVFEADNDTRILSFDSTSQHPAQMVSHLYPQDFTEATPEQLGIAFNICANVKVERVLNYWIKPFPFAFYACFRFTNLRPKAGSVFEHEGIYSLTDARFKTLAPLYENQAATEFKNNIGALGYQDLASGYECSFGKLESCAEGVFFLTELDSWIISRIYEWDSVEPISGYLSSTFRKPTDMSVLSVMRFYKAKNALKEFMGQYQQGKANDVGGIRGLFPDSFVNDCEAGRADGAELREYYMLSKADLNSLFGIEATNECRRDFELTRDGMVLVGEDGLHNMPKSPKCFYQFGQRIVGWSRVAQTVIMELLAPYVENIICGDTDSIKIVLKNSNYKKCIAALKKHARALDKAKRAVLKRAKTCYPDMYDPLAGIGHYIFDGEYQAFMCAWNKAYMGLVNGEIHTTLAGVPTSKRTPGKRDSFDDFANALAKKQGFAKTASTLLAYNVTIDASLTKLNARLRPKSWGSMLEIEVEDYLGNVSKVKAPEAIALFPGLKTIGDTQNPDNAHNAQIALNNNPETNTAPIWIKWRKGRPVIER